MLSARVPRSLKSAQALFSFNRPLFAGPRAPRRLKTLDTVFKSAFLGVCVLSISALSRQGIRSSRTKALDSYSGRVRSFWAKSATSTEMGVFRHIPSKNLHVSTPTWWLESRFHFSFADYYNPANEEFGVLRVLNDDLVKPHSGFGTHPHRDMEIVTYVLDGELTHKDSMGTSESLGRGSIQYMSAGTGITHSEMNDGDKLLRFLQIWIKPNARGLKPNYGSRVLNAADRRNKFQHVLTSFDNAEGHSDKHTGVIPVHQDTNMYVAEMDAGKTLEFSLEKRRQAYVVCMEGRAVVNEKEVTMEARDALEVVAPRSEKLPITFTADNKQGAFIYIIEMAQ